MEKNRLGSCHQWILMPLGDHCGGLHLYSSSADRDHIRNPLNHRIAQDLFVCSNKSRLASCNDYFTPSIIATAKLFRMSLSKEYHRSQLVLFLVGTDTRLPTGLSSISTHEMAVRSKANRGMCRSQCLHMACLCPIRSSRPAKLAQQNGCAGRHVDNRTSDEAFHHLADHLAGRLFRHLPILFERLSRSDAIRRPQVLR